LERRLERKKEMMLERKKEMQSDRNPHLAHPDPHKLYF
jgi:hypothetical protein